MTSPFTDRVVSIIDSIPEGKVLSYGRIAALQHDLSDQAFEGSA